MAKVQYLAVPPWNRLDLKWSRMRNSTVVLSINEPLLFYKVVYTQAILFHLKTLSFQMSFRSFKCDI